MIRMRFPLAIAAACLVLAAPPSAGQARRAAHRPHAARPRPSWIASSVLYEVNIRDFSPTGDFKGVMLDLDRIQAAGANVLWLMPINPVGVVNRKGTLGSPYASRDYRAIEPSFGTAADFRALVRAVHARGMKIIIDWVPDHTSPDNVWVKSHPEYYVRAASGAPSVPIDPQGKPTDWTDVVQLDFHKAVTRQAMIDVMRWWLRTYDLDGFRVDAAGFVPDVFWREAPAALRRSVHRPILLLAEWAELKMHRFGFDLTYPWDSYGRLKDVWRGADASGWLRSEKAVMDSMPAGGMRMRFTTNHDETAWDKPPVILFGGSAGARAAFVAEVLLPGRPLLYDGQEVESPQTLRLFEQDSVVWNQPDTTATRAFYRQVVTLTRTDPAFLGRDFAPLATSDSADVIAYRRGGAAVIVNTRAHDTRITVSGFAVNGAHDLLSGAVVQGDTLALPAYGKLVLERTGDAGARP